MRHAMGVTNEQYLAQREEGRVWDLLKIHFVDLEKGVSEAVELGGNPAPDGLE